MSTARVGAAAATGPDGRIYVFGGTPDGNPVFLSTAEAYDPSTNTWASLPPMSTARDDLSAATGSDGRVYVFGGYIDPTGSPLALDSAEAYSPNTNSWTLVPTMPGPRAQFAAATGSDGRIYLFGGRNSNGYLSTVDAYNTNGATAQDDAYQMFEGTTLHVDPPGVLGNDIGVNLVAIEYTSPTHGTLTLSSDGSFTYVPTDSFIGADSFTYSASTRAGSSAPATVRIDVVAVTGGGGAVGGGGSPPGGATPELDSLLLFGSGLSGLGGYTLMRLRARRRQ